MTIDFLQLPALGEGIDQSLFFDQLKVMLTNVSTDLYAKRDLKIILRQATEPDQAAWESAWTSQTGLPTPILPAATLIWFDNINNYVGGVYGTTHQTDGIVYGREARFPRSGESYRNHVVMTTQITNSNASIGTALTNHPYLEFNLPVVSDVILRYDSVVGTLTGSGSYGGDFLFDGLKVGTAYMGIPATMGIQNYSSPMHLIVHARILNVQPGTHKVQAMLGIVGAPMTPPTISYGGVAAAAGNYGVRTLVVAGITK